MREAMYGFMTLHLKGEGDGDPIPEPADQDRGPRRPSAATPATRDPKDFMTIPKFAAPEGKKLRDGEADAATADALGERALSRRSEVSPDVKPVDMWSRTADSKDLSLYHFQSEPGVKAMVYYRFDANIASA